MIDTCVCCGAYVPEGRQVCYTCNSKLKRNVKPLPILTKKHERPAYVPESSITKKAVTLAVWVPILVVVLIVSPVLLFIEWVMKDNQEGFDEYIQ